jgi:hypothetical protein
VCEEHVHVLDEHAGVAGVATCGGVGLALGQQLEPQIAQAGERGAIALERSLPRAGGPVQPGRLPVPEVVKARRTRVAEAPSVRRVSASASAPRPSSA